jgi:hypothetical protein
MLTGANTGVGRRVVPPAEERCVGYQNKLRTSSVGNGAITTGQHQLLPDKAVRHMTPL